MQELGYPLSTVLGDLLGFVWKSRFSPTAFLPWPPSAFSCREIYGPCNFWFWCGKVPKIEWGLGIVWARAWRVLDFHPACSFHQLIHHLLLSSLSFLACEMHTNEELLWGFSKIIYVQALHSPDQCGSVVWALSRKVKSHQFDSQSGHVPGLWARSSVGASERQPHIDGSLPLSFPSPLSKN